MNKEWLVKLAEAYRKVEDFERAYLSPKAIFNLMHTTGILSEQEAIEMNARYDHTMEPVRKKSREVKNVVYGRAKEIFLPMFGRKKKV